ncbi:expressed unknown protein [Seminavis robusta]|uniref:Uncharacterized protein n=1 Tax=Seminavis robusta TaxID=568900 RepID=A0A9N8E1V4_9STRA|nr:expressed unknown protein [Seminavis robusta]|eukprot:Sro533_g161700.1 n/a (391) ;mRNA; r:41490-42662
MTGILNCVERNGELVLRGDLGDCMDALWEHRTATTIVVEFFENMSETECLMLFAILAGYSTMTSLRVSSLMDKNKLPIKALKALLRNPSVRLDSLHLDTIKLTGDIKDYLVFVESLRLCSLRSVRLEDCEFEDPTIALDPLIRGLATIPTLEHVSLARTKLAPVGIVWNCQCLFPLLPQVRSLTLEEMPDFKTNTICLLALAIEDPSCALKELKILKHRLTRKSIAYIGRMLCKTQSLQDFTLEVKNCRQVIQLAKDLTNNIQSSSLRCLHFPGEWGASRESDYISGLRRAMIDMLQIQVQLKKITLGDRKCGLSRELARYVKMNQQNEQAIREFGRKRESLVCKQKVLRRSTSTKQEGTDPYSYYYDYSKSLLSGLFHPPEKRVRFRVD